MDDMNGMIEAGEDWVLVPRVLTEQMLNVLHDAVLIRCYPAQRNASILNAQQWWESVLAAAPASPLSGRGGEGKETGAPATPTGLLPDGPTASRSSGFAAAIPSRIPAPHLEGPWPRRPSPDRHPDGSSMTYDIPWIKDWRTVTGRTLKEGMEAHRLALHGRMAEGCCSAISPCSHQQRDPYSLCLTCRGVQQRAEASAIEDRQGRDEGSANRQEPGPERATPSPTPTDPVAEARARPSFRSGDIVKHIRTGNIWTVAYADPASNTIAWCGWPDGIARVTDCELIQAADDDQHRGTLRMVLKGGGHRAAAAFRIYGNPDLATLKGAHGEDQK